MQCQANSTAGIVGGARCTDEFVGGHACTVDCCSLDDETHVSNSSSAATDQQTMLFLLGFPFTGTSALHFLVATGHGVGTLGDPNLLGPHKEGWSQVKYEGVPLKDAFEKGTNFDIPDHYIPWTKLVKEYHKLWGSQKPILLESSPPEIMHVHKLKEMFGKDHPERVKFLVLAKQPCNTKLTPWGKKNVFARLALMKQIVKEFRKDVFLLRYEDLCVRPETSAAALERWLPKMGKLNVNARSTPNKQPPQKDPAHDHDGTRTIPEYCEQIAVPSWPVQSNIDVTKADGMPGRYLGGSSINDLMNFFGYTPSFNETK
jgi:hypothetical protein